MKKQAHWRKKKDVRLTHEFYNNLVDDRQSGAVKIARQLLQQKVEVSAVLRFLQSEGIKYHDALHIIKDSL